MNRNGPPGHRWPGGAIRALILFLAAATASAQVRTPLDPDDPNSGKPWGWVVHYIQVAAPTVERDQLLGMLKTKKDAKLTKANIREDIVKIYVLHRIRARVLFRPLKDERVELFFILPPVKRYDRHVFKGMEHLTESEARRIAGIRINQALHEDDAERLRLVISERYRRDGAAIGGDRHDQIVGHVVAAAQAHHPTVEGHQPVAAVQIDDR